MGRFNFFWFLFFGWFSAVLVLILSGFMALTVIGIPIAKSLLQFSKLSALPFGKEVIRDKAGKIEGNVSLLKKTGAIIANLIWFPLGFFLIIVYFLLGIIMISTIIGIPIGMVYMKIGKFIIRPVGTRVIFQKKQVLASDESNVVKKKEKLNTSVEVINI
jgi:uncharacterized membrane protein YccF (DUF307 family)